MKSPFPGMDPYIESCRLWEDFHQKLIGEIERELSRVLPERYAARLGERAYISLNSSDDIEPKQHKMQGDVTVVSTPRFEDSQSSTAVLESPSVALLSQPVEMLAVEQVDYREPFIEIRSAEPDRPLVTTIEVLSPSNKRRNSVGWDLYQRKRISHLNGTANLVEIDLLRGGNQMPMASIWPNSAYRLLVSRKFRAPICSVWQASFSAPLPLIPIPLERPDPDVIISLQPMIEAIYARSRYANDIDYGKPCNPPFNSDEEKWFQDRMAQVARSH